MIGNFLLSKIGVLSWNITFHIRCLSTCPVTSTKFSIKYSLLRINSHSNMNIFRCNRKKVFSTELKWSHQIQSTFWYSFFLLCKLLAFIWSAGSKTFNYNYIFGTIIQKNDDFVLNSIHSTDFFKTFFQLYFTKINDNKLLTRFRIFGFHWFANDNR